MQERCCIMELADYITLPVNVYGQELTLLKVHVRQKNGKIDANTVFKKSCAELGISTDSSSLFALFKGHCTPVQKYSLKEEICSPCPELSLQRWFFSQNVCDKVKADETAVHLLYHQAKHDVTSGIIYITKDCLAELTDSEGEDTKQQLKYLALCERLEGVPLVIIRSCQLVQPLQSMDTTWMKEGAEFSLFVTRQGLMLSPADGAPEALPLPWSHLKRWRRSLDHVTGFGLMFARPHESGRCVVVKATFKTEQASLLLSVVMEITKDLMSQRGASGLLYFAGDGTVRRTGRWQIWDNLLYQDSLEMGVANHGFVPDTG